MGFYRQPPALHSRETGGSPGDAFPPWTHPPYPRPSPVVCVCVGGSVMCGGRDSECITLMTFPLPTLNLNDLSVLALLSNTCKPSHDSHMSTHQCTKHAFPKVLFSKIHPVYLTSTESPLSTDCEGSCGGHVGGHVG